MSATARLSTLLRDSAEALRPAASPICVSSVCAGLGVRVIRQPAQRKAVLVAASSGPEVHLPARDGDPRFTPLERFHVAHELGHYLLAKHRLFPLGTSEYWQHEVACDYFARMLLVHDSHVDSFPNRPRAVWSLADTLCSRASVPAEVAFARISDVHPRLVFLILCKSERDWRVVFSTLPSKREIRRKVRPDATLHAVLDRMIPGTIGGLSKSLVSVIPALANADEISFRATTSAVSLAARLETFGS